MEIEARDIDDLQQVSNAIHDAWFEKADIRYHPERQVVEIPIKREKWEGRKTIKHVLFVKKLSVPIIRSTLSVAHVQSYEIQDTARIGLYDIRGIHYGDDSVVISSNFPCIVTLKVSQLEVSLADTDEVVKEIAIWSLFR